MIQQSLKTNIEIQEENFTPYHLTMDDVLDWKNKTLQNPHATIALATMFSGIGAIEYAFKRLNLKTNIVFACDNDNFVKQSYFANYEITENNWYQDVCDIDGNEQFIFS